MQPPSRDHATREPGNITGSLTQVLTVRGRTSAVLMMEPISQENTGAIRDAFLRTLPQQAREQIRYIFTDDPSPVLFQGMKARRHSCPREGALASAGQDLRVCACVGAKRSSWSLCPHRESEELLHLTTSPPTLL